MILKAPHTRAEVIARTLAIGGYSMARGHLVGLAPDIKAHLECRGLILGNGVVHAIPELEGRVAGVDMSHEAAVGKIAAEEVEYLMARGLDEDEAVSTIVRGFLNVKIEGLPPALEEEMEHAIQASWARGCIGGGSRRCAARLLRLPDGEVVSPLQRSARLLFFYTCAQPTSPSRPEPNRSLALAAGERGSVPGPLPRR